MTDSKNRLYALIATGLALSVAGSAAARPIDTGFTYQGQLVEDGRLVDGLVDIVFMVWDAETGGKMTGGQSVPKVPVEHGRFSVELSLGPCALSAEEPRWLEIAANGRRLEPRQLITPAPLAGVARIAAGIDEHFRIDTTIPGGACLIHFGPTDISTIGLNPRIGSGMVFTDPDRFLFDGGPVFARAFIPSSSARWKEDIREIDDALETVRMLRGVTFTWTKELGGRPGVGFIAEEVGAVLPDVVTRDDDGSARGVNYNGLVAVAVEAIKAQQAQIAELNSANDALREELRFLAQRIERVEARLESAATDGGAP